MDCSEHGMELNEIKKRMYAMRNGVVADALRKSGTPYRMIFGVNVPQLAEIAREIGPSVDAARMLWADGGLRESLMLATMLYPPQDMDMVTAECWLQEAPTAEVIDLLCHRVIRHVPFAVTLAGQLMLKPDDKARYAGLRIYFNLLPAHVDEARKAASEEVGRGSVMTRSIAVALLDEIDFLVES